MVGGIVIEVVFLEDEVFVDCMDSFYSDTCAIMVKRDEKSEKIDIGDQIWWQGRNAYWTPQKLYNGRGPVTGVSCDIALIRIGYSGANIDFLRSRSGPEPTT
jgi:hypothetical protein